MDVQLNQQNKKTIAAILEVERIALDPNVNHYSDKEDTPQELKNKIKNIIGKPSYNSCFVCYYRFIINPVNHQLVKILLFQYKGFRFHHARG